MNTKTAKKILIAVVLFGTLFALIPLIPTQKTITLQRNSSAEDVQTLESQDKAIIRIDFGNEIRESEQFEIHKTQTAHSMLAALLDKKDMPIETEQYDFGIFVKSINGLENTSEKAWIYYVNGELGQVAADAYDVKSGDIVEWKYVEPEY